MLIYFVVLAIVVAAVYQASKAGTGRFERISGYAIAFIVLILLAGLRSENVGTDTYMYVHKFQQIGEWADIWKTQQEPGLYLLCWLGKFISSDYALTFTLVAVIVTLCYLWGIRRYSVNPTISAFVLLVSGINFFSYNTIRHGIAFALCFLAIPMIYQRKFWLFLILVALASFFHLSSLLFLPAYFILPPRTDFRIFLLLIMLFASAVIYFQPLAELTKWIPYRGEWFSTYGVPRERAAGVTTTIFTGILGIFFLYFRRYVTEHRPLYELLVNMFLMGMIIAILSVFKKTNPSGPLRISHFFTAGQILLWPIVVMNIKDPRFRPLFLTAFVIFYLIYYPLSLQRFSNLVPYTFNPSVQQWFSTLF